MQRSNILAPLLACGTAPHEPEWMSLGTNPEGTNERFVDVSSIRITGNIRSAWIKTVHAPHSHTLGDIPVSDQTLQRAVLGFPRFNRWGGLVRELRVIRLRLSANEHGPSHVVFRGRNVLHRHSAVAFG